MGTPSIAGNGRSPFLTSEGAAAIHKALGFSAQDFRGLNPSDDDVASARKRLGV